MLSYSTVSQAALAPDLDALSEQAFHPSQITIQSSLCLLHDSHPYFTRKRKKEEEMRLEEKQMVALPMLPSFLKSNSYGDIIIFWSFEWIPPQVESIYHTSK